MKNKIFLIYFLFCLNFNFSIAEEYNFEVSKIELSEEGNLINAHDGKIFLNDKETT